MVVLPLELTEAPAMQVNLLPFSSTIASAIEEDLHMCYTSRTFTCTSRMLSSVTASRTEIWTSYVGNVLRRYTKAFVKHVCTRSSPEIQQEISVPLMHCSAFIKIIA